MAPLGRWGRGQSDLAALKLDDLIAVLGLAAAPVVHDDCSTWIENMAARHARMHRIFG